MPASDGGGGSVYRCCLGEQGHGNENGERVEEKNARANSRYIGLMRNLTRSLKSRRAMVTLCRMSKDASV
jgi:hypothetical protein